MLTKRNIDGSLVVYPLGQAPFIIAGGGAGNNLPPMAVVNYIIKL